MAQSTSPGVPTGLALRPLVTRSNSITSTNSANSTASLRRRSRTRTRTLTSAGRRGKSIGAPDVSKRSGPENGAVSQPEIPPVPARSPRRPRAAPSRLPISLQETRDKKPHTRERALSAVHVRDTAGGDANRGRATKSEGGSVKALKLRARGMSLPRSAFRTMSSSDESSQASPRTPISFSAAPSVHVVNEGNRHFRDSITSTSSSLYPRSTSSESYPESSIHPRSLRDKDEDVSSFSPRIVTQNASNPDFDVDDVSYRLRLLVNNSYFLPPAHAKPTPLSLAPPAPPPGQRASKQAAPGFLDFFRMGKSKSKPSTPSPTVDVLPGPVLRTTSDSTTASGYLPHSTRSVPQTPLHPPYPMQSAPGSRVVVLRERMDDLMEAAKQAERDIKLRGDGRKARSQATPRGDDFFDDVVDPTDAVDLPPSSSAAYPFAFQASALHGLSPQDSVGAATMADFLPPSPGMWSMSSEEETWRKAILHEAISLSLNESPETSFSSMSPTSLQPDLQSPSFPDSVLDKSEEAASPPTPKVMLGKRIMEPLHIDDADERGVLSPLQALRSLPSAISSLSSPVEPSEAPWRSPAHPPRRAETPAATMPLTPPPPRKQLQPSCSSMMSPETVPDDLQDPNSPPGMRRKRSSSSLTDARSGTGESSGVGASADPAQERTLTLSPPIISRLEDMPSFAAQLSHPRASPYTEDDELSYVTPMDGDMDDEGVPRQSLTLSLPSERPSFSEYSLPSPTASAFQDAVFGSCRTPSPMLFRRSHVGSLGPTTQPSASPEPNTRDVLLSPPPRTSSSLGPPTNVLPPPPRSPAVRPVYRPSTSSGTSDFVSLDRPSSTEHSFSPESDRPDLPSISRDSMSPPSLAERRGSSSLSLHVPTEFMSPPIHSAPAPASPTAFFDRIQSHPNAMDDLDTSDESDDDDDDCSLPAVEEETAEVFVDPRTLAISNRASSSSARPSIMRLGNHSTPQLTPTPSIEEPLPPYDADRRKPIGNIAERNTFFTARAHKKGVIGHSPFPLRPVDSRSLSQESLVPGSTSDGSPSRPRPRAASSSKRPSTATGAGEKVRAWQRESIQRFDGMLLEHMAAERDTIKRITSNISHSRS